LEEEIQMAVGARVTLRRNIGTEDGLVNGVTGTEWPEGVPVDSPDRQPIAINVLFDNERVGRLGRQFTMEREGNIGAPVPHAPMAITPATASFMTKNKRHHPERYQFPLELAWVVTIHRVQGLSLDRAVIDLGESIFAHRQAYAALSRVKTLAGVLLSKLSARCLALTDPKIREEYAHLLNV